MTRSSRQSAIPPAFGIFICGTIWLSARNSAQTLHPAADLEPSLVRRLSLGLYDGAGRRPVALPDYRGSSAAASAIWPAAPDRAAVLLPPIASSCCHTFLRRTRCSATGTITPCSLPSSCSASARARYSILGGDGASALDRTVARGRVLSVLSRDVGDQVRRHAAENPGRLGLRILSMALHGRAARLRAAMADRGFAGAALSHRCDVPYYIVHQTAIIMIAHALRGQGLPAGLEAGIVILGTIAACVATYEIVRRITILRPLFGLRMASEPAMPVRARSQPAQ